MRRRYKFAGDLLASPFWYTLVMVIALSLTGAAAITLLVVLYFGIEDPMALRVAVTIPLILGILDIIVLVGWWAVKWKNFTRETLPSDEIPGNWKRFPSGSKYLSAEETAYHLRRTPSEVRDLVRSGRMYLSWAPTPGRISTEEVQRYLRSHPEEVKRMSSR